MCFSPLWRSFFFLPFDAACYACFKELRIHRKVNHYQMRQFLFNAESEPVGFIIWAIALKSVISHFCARRLLPGLEMVMTQQL